MPIINTKDIIDPTKYQLPTDQYVAHILKFDHKVSNAGNPMTELQCEIMSPGRSSTVASRSPAPAASSDSTSCGRRASSAPGLIEAKNALEKLGWPVDEPFNTDVHAKELFDNCCFRSRCKVSLATRPRMASSTRQGR